jgi:hypothetical protein
MRLSGPTSLLISDMDSARMLVRLFDVRPNRNAPLTPEDRMPLTGNKMFVMIYQR